ncbi:endonuclease/exonuclease/phosphatase family protein [Paraglaciecola aquimarina]|uniref:Endonuclease/exonuclease/phosphatase family protein n=1 Tax=Paraglaciecola aquimarina TaxID=1235557 RepID=A0ABU3SS95_9ALTE|nr:endonuclease/exonuclease/phosphatase family protein [Paraglaciecola aquimarina]MDU0352874.1 endonuclease/exonuclease/phosphatase family protein [Paraglaciecola aquimarina]
MLRIVFLMVVAMSQLAQAEQIRVATFNVSMDATNYVEDVNSITGDELFERLATGEHQQIKNIAEIIQHVRPDIILLNEFDYTDDDTKGVLAFTKNYLAKSQHGKQPIDYPYYYTAPVNTGVGSGHDLNKDGVASGTKDDAFGFGFYPGQYGMVLLSRFPIDKAQVRTFQLFKWQDMPNNTLTTIADENGQPWYSAQAQQDLRLSSKSHWDVPINVNGQTLHVLASHPTPPVFDGPENRNGKRNHDEVRFWVDYISGGQQAGYIYDDKGHTGGFSGQRFVVMGDLNSSMSEGDSHKQAIVDLLTHTKVNADIIPKSKGGKAHTPNNHLAATHTAGWRMRADYALPAKAGLTVQHAEVFWPTKDDALYRLIKDRSSSSDHRLVWLDLVLENSK